ncbi:MAG TPA: class I SAM-dependent methyltransferase [Acidimicrobiales bacterium]|nr:class I SAM-dependent methyltransferase [Acidimicrobiales bacterium]
MILPPMVEQALRRAEASGFTLSSEPEVGALLACLAASVAPGGRILELGTGVGTGLAWLVHGLGGRTDVHVVSVDVDETLQAHTRSAPWPPYVRFELGDGADLVPGLGTFDLIFADAPGGKITGLRDTIDALCPGGMLVVDDMDVTRHDDADLRLALTRVRERLVADDRLVCAELAFSSGVIVAVRRRDGAES